MSVGCVIAENINAANIFPFYKKAYLIDDCFDVNLCKLCITNFNIGCNCIKACISILERLVVMETFPLKKKQDIVGFPHPL